MSGRATISPKTMVTVAIMQADQIRCPLCRHDLHPDEVRVLEHMTPRATRLALGLDPDAEENLAWVHKECADRKTFGKSKATCADGDIHRIAKAKRLAAARDVHEQVKARVIDRPPGSIRNKGFDKSKTKSFPTKKKPFGEVRTR